MARLWTSGAEWNDVTAEAVTGGASLSIATANPRTGTYHYRSTSAAISWVRSFTGAVGTTYYVRNYYTVSALPGVSVNSVLAFVDAGLTYNVTVRLYPDGSVDLVAAGTVIGTSAAGAVSAGSYNMFELALLIGVGATDYCEARLNGVSFASGLSLTISDTAPGTLRFLGPVQSAATADVDDVAMNDSTGAAQTSWPGSGKVVLLRPISLNTNGGSWTDDAAATTSAALTAALDNAPPKGIADTVAGGGDHQVRNAAANSSLDMNLATYATAGIASGDTINVVEPQVNVGAPVVTAAKTGSFGISANPVIANRVFTGGGTAAANFWRGVASAAYPTGWGWERGTVTYAPAVTVASSPVARLTITGGTTTRIAMADAIGLYVDYTPAAAPVVRVPRAPAIDFADPAMFMKALRPAFRKVRDRIFVPELWLPGMPV